MASQAVLAFSVCLAFGLGGFSAHCFGAKFERPDVSLFLDAEAGSMTAVWYVKEWPEGVESFLLKRRPAGTDAAWTSVTAQPLQPDLSLTRNWGLVDPDPSRHDGYRKALQKELEDGNLPVLGRGELLQLAKTSPDLRLGLFARTLDNPTFALLAGIGVVDRRGPFTGPPLEYGLFAVAEDGAVGAEPLATAVRRLYDEKDPYFSWPDLPVTVTNDRTVSFIDWEFPEDRFRGLGLNGFMLKRAPVVDGVVGDFQDVTASPLGPRAAENGMALARMSDQNVRDGTDYIYQVVPVSVFGRHYPAFRSDVHHYKSEARMPKPLVRPTAEVKQLTTTSVRIAWTFAPDSLPDIRHFEVHRDRYDEPKKETIARDLPAAATEYVDSDLPPVGTTVKYRVYAIDKRGVRRRSSPHTLVIRHLAATPTPAGP